ncbi:hypothetical protein LOTGIDRAFT_208924 [Lottia gigantea]|uniref:Synaptic plasticity regulator PANTS n=1 Tax=Lottia gigantea TaxID=225164 RepID=V4ASD3_LOTGI|nr:hypothetical protein LOTGIDRAFT_208924 [Lottia gigantea]ESO97780.1 hypothetical protein LOTGIDRAFT_208924 [Lottia gigantea]
MVRPCEMYVQEFKECTSKQGREHQMYIFGRHMNCSKWEEDKENCFKLRNGNDSSAAIKIIKHELIRREKRMAAAKNNDVWEYRTGPPDDWDKPLKGWMEQKENTNLTATQAVEKGRSCVIS